MTPTLGAGCMVASVTTPLQAERAGIRQRKANALFTSGGKEIETFMELKPCVSSDFCFYE